MTLDTARGARLPAPGRAAAAGGRLRGAAAGVGRAQGASGCKLTTRSRTKTAASQGGRRLRLRPGPAGRLPDRPGGRRRRRSAPRSWPSWPGSRCRWCGCAASGSSWTTGSSRPRSGRSSRRRERRADRRRGAQQVVDGGDEDLPLVEVDADGVLGDLLSGAGRPSGSPRCPTPRDVPGHAAALPGARPVLAALPGPARPGRHPRRRHGPGQDRADAVAAAGRARRRGRTRSRPTLLVCPMSLVSNWQKEAARFAPALRVYVHHGGSRQAGRRVPGRRWRTPTWCITTYGTALRDLGALRDIDWGRVVCDEAQAIKNSGTRQAQAVRAIPARHPAGADRHAGGEPPGRAVVDHGVLQPRAARPGQDGSGARFQEPIEVAAGRGRRRGAQAGHRPVRAAPPQDRQVDHLRPAGEAGDEGLVHAHRRAGHALPGRGRRHAGEDRGQRGHRAAGQRAGRDDQAQAGLQPPGPPAQGRLAAGRPVRQAGPAGGAGRGDRRRGRQGAGLHPVRRVRLAAAAATSPPTSTGRCCGCTAGCPRRGATSWSSGSRPTTSRCCSCSRSRRPAPAST